MAEERPGFLGRWARRKSDVSLGKALEEPAAVVKPAPVAAAAASPVAGPSASPVASPSGASAAEQPVNVLSLDDVKLLTQDSDFTPFMARDVGPDVRNAAMKKLFTDPHYNVMDGLDIYIDDYSKSDPIPESMLRQMVGAKLLKIFDDDEDDEGIKEGAAAQTSEAPLLLNNLNNPTDETMAQSEVESVTGLPSPVTSEHISQPELSAGSGASKHHDHADSHLRLQPDHAPTASSAGHGT